MTNKIDNLWERVKVIFVAILIVWLLYVLFKSVQIIVTYDFWGGSVIALITCAFLFMSRRDYHAKD